MTRLLFLGCDESWAKQPPSRHCATLSAAATRAAHSASHIVRVHIALHDWGTRSQGYRVLATLGLLQLLGSPGVTPMSCYLTDDTICGEPRLAMPHRACILGQACISRGLVRVTQRLSPSTHTWTNRHTIVMTEMETGYKVLISKFHSFYVARPESRWYLFTNACQNPQSSYSSSKLRHTQMPRRTLSSSDGKRLFRRTETPNL
jgi:hypothetical protein